MFKLAVGRRHLCQWALDAQREHLPANRAAANALGVTGKTFEDIEAFHYRVRTRFLERCSSWQWGVDTSASGLSMPNGNTFPLIEPQPMPSALPERRSKILRHFTIAFGQDSWKDVQAGSGASTPLPVGSRCPTGTPSR